MSSQSLSSRVISSRFVLPVRALRDDIFIRHFVALMTFVVMVMTSMTLFLFALSREWTADVLTSATLEIPSNAVEKLPQIERILAAQKPIDSYDILTQDKVLQLVSPWFGDDVKALGSTISVPILITLDLNSNQTIDTAALLKSVQQHVPQARLITHGDWLAPMQSLAMMFQTIGVGSLALLLIALVMAIHGAARGRVATHREALEILHLMGATDGYIMGQFQAYFLRLLYPGLIRGFLIGLVVIGAAWVWLDTRDIALLPVMTGETMSLMLLILIGVGMALLGLLALAARRAVAQTLIEFTWI